MTIDVFTVINNDITGHIISLFHYKTKTMQTYTDIGQTVMHIKQVGLVRIVILC